MLAEQSLESGGQDLFKAICGLSEHNDAKFSCTSTCGGTHTAGPPSSKTEQLFEPSEVNYIITHLARGRNGAATSRYNGISLRPWDGTMFGNFEYTMRCGGRPHS